MKLRVTGNAWHAVKDRTKKNPRHSDKGFPEDHLLPELTAEYRPHDNAQISR
jgi:hypothetical protein